MRERRQSSTTYPLTFLLVSSTDHVTAVTGVSPTVTLSKNGAAFAAAAGAVTEIGSGWYSLAGNATDRNTLGELLLHATATGADPHDAVYAIVPWDPFDASLGITALAEMHGLLGKHAVVKNTSYSSGNLLTYDVALYDTAAHASTDDGVTGIVATYSVTNTYDGSNNLTKSTMVRN